MLAQCKSRFADLIEPIEASSSAKAQTMENSEECPTKASMSATITLMASGKVDDLNISPAALKQIHLQTGIFIVAFDRS